MNNNNASVKDKAVPYAVDESCDEVCRYGGIPALKESWRSIGGESVWQQANIRYGQGEDKAADIAFLLLSAPFVNARSQRRVTQRFGGEASEQEGDVLLAGQVAHVISQRTLNRFVNTQRYEWLAVQAKRAQQLQQLPGYKMNRKGVVIVDDWPLIKAYATAMPYLSSIWDNNLKCALPG